MATNIQNRRRPQTRRRQAVTATHLPQAATLRSQADGYAPVQAYSRPGLVDRDVGRRLDALIVRTVRDCARQSMKFALLWQRGWAVPHFLASRIRQGLSSAARRCVLSRLASPGTRKCATSTSTRTTSSTRRRWRRGSGRRPPCPAGSRSAGRDPRKQSVAAPSRDLTIPSNGFSRRAGMHRPIRSLRTVPD